MDIAQVILAVCRDSLSLCGLLSSIIVTRAQDSKVSYHSTCPPLPLLLVLLPAADRWYS